MKKKIALLLAALLLCAQAAFADEPAPETAPASEPVRQEETREEAEPEAQLTEKSEEQPMEEPKDEPTEEPKDEPTEEPKDEPTEEPKDEPTEEPKDEPTEEPKDEPTEEPKDDPTEEPLTGDVYARKADGTLTQGTLAEVLAALAGEEGDITVYVRAETVLRAEDVTMEDVAHIAFKPDAEVFDEKEKYAAHASDQNLNGEPDDKPVLYVWVDKPEDPEEPEDPEKPDKPDPVEMELTVEAQGLKPGEWANEAPRFTLSGIPDGTDKYAYAVVAYDERFIILSGDTFEARDEGAYQLRFTILDGIGDVAAKSAKYALKLDFHAPISLMAAMEDGAKTRFDVSAQDELSGVKEYSVDGGETWHPADEQGIYVHTAKKGDKFPAGSIQARDNAGNVAEYPEEFILPGKQGGGGGGGKKDDDTKKIVHAPSAELNLDPYNALTLQLSEEPMQSLTVGDTALPLTIQTEKGEPAQFRASFITWGGDTPEGEAPDTLVLTVDGEAPAGEYGYKWAFNGLVYKMLFNSGIEYLAFCEDGRVTALSTAGFTAGAAFTRLKADGVSTKKFEYALWQRGGANVPEDARSAMEVRVETEENAIETYALTEDAKAEMYIYNVVTGGKDMMRRAFGMRAQDEKETYQ